jgi:hypothetical protein
MTVAEARRLTEGAVTIGAPGWGLYNFMEVEEDEEENQFQEETHERYESFQWDRQDGEGC